MKTYWYLFPVIGFIWFIIDAILWKPGKIAPIEAEHIWQYAYPFYALVVHIPCALLINFYFFVF